MDKLVVTSMHQGAGKTTAIIGIAKALNKSIGYIKPFGKRFLYKKKRLWDYDAALITNIFGLKENPEDMSIGFHHSKLSFMLNEEAIRERLLHLEKEIGKQKDLFFVEAGRDLVYGASVFLDAMSLARYLRAEVLMVVDGDDDVIIDDLTFLKKYIKARDIRLRGVMINKVSNLDDFMDNYLPRIETLGFPILGVVPFYEELSLYSVNFLADRLFAKVLAGEEGLQRMVRKILVGSMVAPEVLKNPLFQEKDKAIITSGDRADMIAAALETSTAAIVLSNNIMPSPYLLSKAEALKVPILLCTSDTFQIAKQIDTMDCLPTKDDAGKIRLIEDMIRKHINLQSFSQA